MAVRNTLPGTLCYIRAGYIDKTVEIWSRSLTSEYTGRSYVDHLQDLMEKTIVLALATGQKQFSASLHKLVEKYAEILASQWILTTEKEVPKSRALENSHSQPGTTYGADQSSFGMVEFSGHYSQAVLMVETTSHHLVLCTWGNMVLRPRISQHQILKCLFHPRHLKFRKRQICKCLFHPRHLKFPRFLHY